MNSRSLRTDDIAGFFISKLQKLSFSQEPNQNHIMDRQREIMPTLKISSNLNF